MRSRATARVLAVIGVGMGLAMIAACGDNGSSALLGGTGNPLTLSNGTTQVTITSRPFRMLFTDGNGKQVLGEVVNTRPQPLTQGADPTGSASVTPDRTLYAPLTFMVGTFANNQYTGVWAGNQKETVSTGVTYSAQDVQTVSRNGNTLELTLSTNDPTGRVIQLRLSPGAAGTIRVQATPVPSQDVVMVSDSFASAASEAFHGFGGRHNALDQHGEDFYNWIEEENIGLGPILPSSAAYMFPNGPHAAYHVHGTFVSSRNYGFLLNRYELSRFRLDSDRPDAWQIQVAAPTLDYSVVAAAPAAAIAALTSITGRQRVAPEWAMRPMIDRNKSTVSLPDPPGYAAHVRQDLANILQYNLPISGYRIEGWAQMPTGMLQPLMAAFSAQSIHTLLYFKSFVSGDANDLDLPGTFQTALDNNYVADNADGAPYQFMSNNFGKAAVIDFSNPAAITWWQQRIREALDLGADGFMQDFGEQTLSDMHFHNGQTGAVMHNRYPVLYHAATRKLLDQYQQQHPDREIFFYTRSGHSGTADEPGSLSYDNANFLGDATTDYSIASGLPSQIPDMLNRGIGGAYGSTTDIGGYFDILTGAPNKELFVRWAELATFTPFFRLHNSSTRGVHMPWDYDQQTLDIYRQYANLHIAALPLIRSLWQEAVATGMPVMRPLWLEFPGDATAARQEQEFMLGSDVLVAPVVTQGATSREVYLPAGCWQAQPGGAQTNGPATLKVDAALESLPYFFRCGKKPF